MRQNIQLENVEAMLTEYEQAVRNTTAKGIDAGACGTAWDFKLHRAAEMVEEELRTKLMLEISRILAPNESRVGA